MSILITPAAPPNWLQKKELKSGNDAIKNVVSNAVDNSDVYAISKTMKGTPVPLLPSAPDAYNIAINAGARDVKDFYQQVLLNPNGFKNVSFWLRHTSPELRRLLGNSWYKYQPYARIVVDKTQDELVKQIVNNAAAVVKPDSNLSEKDKQRSNQKTRLISQVVALGLLGQLIQQQLTAGKLPIKEIADKYAKIRAKGKISPEIYYNMKEYLPKLSLALALGGKYDLSRSTMYDYGAMTNNDLIKGWAKNNWTYYGIPIAATALLGGGLIWGLSSLFSGDNKKKKRRRRPGYYGAEPEGYKQNGYYDIA